MIWSTICGNQQDTTFNFSPYMCAHINGNSIFLVLYNGQSSEAGLAMPFQKLSEMVIWSTICWDQGLFLFMFHLALTVYSELISLELILWGANLTY